MGQMDDSDAPCAVSPQENYEPESMMGQMDNDEAPFAASAQEEGDSGWRTSNPISINSWMENILGESSSTQNLEQLPQSQTTDGATDDEGHATISEILDWKAHKSTRKFLVKFKKGDEEQWLLERDLRGCIDSLNKFCDTRVPAIPRTKMKLPDGIGATRSRQQNTANWVRGLNDIVQAARTYGDREGLQPQVLEEQLGDEDAIYITRVGFHSYTILFKYESRLCIVADGKNSLRKDSQSRKIVMHKLRRARCIIFVQAYNQVEEDHCGSSAAGIAIEFQRLHKRGIIPCEARVAKSTMDRLRSRFHHTPSQKLRTREDVRREALNWKLECPNCGKRFKTTNRGAMNLHSCP